jgi:hypothetical protein
MVEVTTYESSSLLLHASKQCRHTNTSSLTFARVWGGLGKPTAFGAPSLAIVDFACAFLPARRGRPADSSGTGTSSCHNMTHQYCSVSNDVRTILLTLQSVKANVQENVHVDNADGTTNNMPDENMKENSFLQRGEGFVYVWYSWVLFNVTCSRDTISLGTSALPDISGYNVLHGLHWHFLVCGLYMVINCD